MWFSALFLWGRGALLRLSSQTLCPGHLSVWPHIHGDRWYPHTRTWPLLRPPSTSRGELQSTWRSNKQPLQWQHDRRWTLKNTQLLKKYTVEAVASSNNRIAVVNKYYENKNSSMIISRSIAKIYIFNKVKLTLSKNISRYQFDTCSWAW